jgi:regulator of sirC expression with transglutaminase-like and TPR domain
MKITKTKLSHDEDAALFEQELRKENTQLKKENEKLTRYIKDSAAYLRFAFGRGDRESLILSTLAHDLKGLANNEVCFLPRVDGYAKWEQEHKK